MRNVLAVVGNHSTIVGNDADLHHDLGGCPAALPRSPSSRCKGKECN
jgi:hypothetical protein